jgi:hypothetical protein
MIVFCCNTIVRQPSRPRRLHTHVMKNLNLKILLPLLVLCIVLLAVSLRQNAVISDFPMTETALWNSAEYAIPATKTPSFISTIQSWTATPTSIFPTHTPTPTTTPATPPLPTATFPIITPMTVAPLSGIHLSGKVYYLDFKSLDLGAYHFDKPFEIDNPPNYYYDPPLMLYQGVWSTDNQYLAYSATLVPIRNSLPKYKDLSVCILNVNQDKSKCFRIYTSIFNHLSVTQGSYAEIKNISWSPDNKYLLVTGKGLGITSPCIVEVETGSVDCRWSNAFIYRGVDNAVVKIIIGAHAISWSPKDENKLAIPLKKNWYPVSEGAQDSQAPFDITPWDVPTDDLKQGLYLVDITQNPAPDQMLQLLWETPFNTTMDSDQLPLWTSDGKQIAFVYLDPWFTVERNPRYPNIPTANYAVGMIGEDGQNFQKLFDSTSMYLSGVLPSDSSIPAINIHRWLYKDRFILFTAQVYRSIEDKYKQSLFLYDTETKQFFQLTNWNELQ